MLKQIISGFVVTSMLLSTLPVLSVSAVTNLNVGISDASAKVNDEFTTKITITDIPSTGISVMDFAVKFDADVIEINDLSLDAFKETASDIPTFSSFIDNDSGCVSILYTNTTETTGDWIVDDTATFTISGTITGNSATGTSKLEIIPINRKISPDTDEVSTKFEIGFINSTGTITDYNVNTTIGTITITGQALTGLKGDANCDGVVNVSDAVAITAFVSNASKNSLTKQGQLNADVQGNNDGINASDAFKVQQYATGVLREL